MQYSDIIMKMIEWSDLTQKELAKKSGLTECTISRYVKGTRIPRIDDFERICDAAGFDIKVSPKL